MPYFPVKIFKNLCKQNKCNWEAKLVFREAVLNCESVFILSALAYFFFLIYPLASLAIFTAITERQNIFAFKTQPMKTSLNILCIVASKVNISCS